MKPKCYPYSIIETCGVGARFSLAEMKQPIMHLKKSVKD